MEAYVTSRRRGKNTAYNNQIIIEAKEIDSREETKDYVGKKVTYTTKSGKELKGKVTAPHGNSGAMRARLRKGTPSSIEGSKIEIEE